MGYITENALTRLLSLAMFNENQESIYSYHAKVKPPTRSQSRKLKNNKNDKQKLKKRKRAKNVFDGRHSFIFDESIAKLVTLSPKSSKVKKMSAIIIGNVCSGS